MPTVRPVIQVDSSTGLVPTVLVLMWRRTIVTGVTIAIAASIIAAASGPRPEIEINHSNLNLKNFYRAKQQTRLQTAHTQAIEPH